MYLYKYYKSDIVAVNYFYIVFKICSDATYFEKLLYMQSLATTITPPTTHINSVAGGVMLLSL